MFNRFWREYPWFLQLLLFGLMVFTLMSFSFVVIFSVVPMITGLPVAKVLDITAESSDKIVTVFIWVQGFTNLFTFAFTALLFAHQTHPSTSAYLGLKPPQKALQPLWAVLLMIGATPVFLEMAALLKDVSGGANAAQAKTEEIFKVVLDIKNGGELARALFVLAIIPAVSEELFFRGVLFRLLHQQGKRMGLAIIISALVFSLAHPSAPYNYLPIFLAGVLLCAIYIYTGSLWCNILAHCCYNGAQIILAYVGRNNNALKEIEANGHMPVSITAAGMLLFALSFYMLWKQRTPLAANWSDNFRDEETAESENE